MAAGYLIDTNIMVHAIRQKKGRQALLAALADSGRFVACSALTVGELYAGMKSHEKARTEALLAGLEIYDVTEDIARYAGLLKNEWFARGFTFGLVDMTIAATAISMASSW